jgi:hypothetical protein
MRIVGAIVILCVGLALAACGESGGTAPGASGQTGEAAYQQAYKDAWVKACKVAVADIHRRDRSRRVGRVTCARPQGQQEGNTAYDPTNARAQGREEGTFDGCAYAWDEAYASSGVDVEPRC